MSIQRKPETVAAHGVRAPSPDSLPDGERGVPSAEPLYQTAAFDFADLDAWERPLAAPGQGYAYARYGLPNARSLELTVAALEGAEDALATSSGMAAFVCGVLASVPHPAGEGGARIAVQADAYGGTLSVLRQDLARLGVTVEEMDPLDPISVGRALERRPRLCVIETLSNPLLRAAPIATIAQMCKATNVPLLVDNTFATPILARPLADGAQLVVHSATKFLGGHHDLCAGVLCGSVKVIDEARGVARRLGCVASPFDAWLACRGLRTLAVRMERAQANARTIAERLRTDGRVQVHFPGWGALVSFDLGTRAAASSFLRALELVTLTPSLGGTTSTLSHAASSSHRGLTPDARHALGIGEGLLRLSVGIESVDDLWADLSCGLARALGQL